MPPLTVLKHYKRQPKRRRITELDRERFTNGDCHILARELSRVTGRPMTFFDDGDGGPDLHAFITTPDGRYAVDVYGKTPVAKFRKAWWEPRSKFVECSEDEVQRHWGFVTEFGPYSRRRARELAPQIAKDAGLIE